MDDNVFLYLFKLQTHQFLDGLLSGSAMFADGISAAFSNAAAQSIVSKQFVQCVSQLGVIVHCNNAVSLLKNIENKAEIPQMYYDVTKNLVEEVVNKLKELGEEW